MEARRPRALEAGLFLLVVGLPLAFFPQSEATFVDVKLLVLALGTMLIWLSGLRADPRLIGPAVAAAVVLGIAWLFAVDRSQALVGSVRPTGIAMLACGLALAVVAPSIPAALLDRARGWLVWTALVTAAVAVANNIFPELLDALVRRESFLGATFGNPVILAGFLAAAIPAALADARARPWRIAVVLAVLGLGLAVVGQRSAYLLPPVAFLAAWWRVRPDRRRLAVAGGAMLVAVLVWSAIPSATGVGEGTSSAVAGQFGTLIGEQQRLAVLGANVRAIGERPVIGWGPGNEWTAYVSSGTPDQLETAGRFWGDPHNLVVEIGVIAGSLGLLAFGWLFVRLARGVVRPASGRGWAAASALTLAVYSMYEPLDVTLTPLMFLLAATARGPTGVVARASERDHAPVPAIRQAVSRSAVAIALAAVTAVAGVGLASSALEEWGRTHAGSRWALELAWAIAPWRLSAAEGLAIDLAIDGRAGDQAAAAEARDVVRRIVLAHPRNPGVRLLAADVELLLRNFPQTQEWIRRHLDVFPNDDIRVPQEEPGTTIPV